MLYYCSVPRDLVHADACVAILYSSFYPRYAIVFWQLTDDRMHVSAYYYPPTRSPPKVLRSSRARTPKQGKRITMAVAQIVSLVFNAFRFSTLAVGMCCTITLQTEHDLSLNSSLISRFASAPLMSTMSIRHAISQIDSAHAISIHADYKVHRSSETFHPSSTLLEIAATFHSQSHQSQASKFWCSTLRCSTLRCRRSTSTNASSTGDHQLWIRLSLQCRQLRSSLNLTAWKVHIDWI